MLDDQQRNRVFNIIIITQCLGMLSGALFQNGFYLNYFSKLGISSASIAMLFALPPLLSSFLLLPCAFYSDRFGKKKLALGGQVLAIAGLLLMMVAGGFVARAAMVLVVVSLVLASIGGSLQGASWFALLNPIIPREIRGRFFGRLRVSFQLVGILFTMLITRALKISQTMLVFKFLLAIVFIASVVRYFTYARIPELENARGETETRRTFRKSFAAVFAVPGYASFNSYVFLITLFTAAIPVIFGLMQKDVFAFTPSQITLMGMLFLVGSVIGCWVGGRLVDRRGTRFVFLIAHVAYAFIMLSLLVRHWTPWPLIAHVGGCSLSFSLIAGMAGVAVTSEIMALIPVANKSLSTGFTMTLVNGAAALSGMCVARSISWKILSPEWTMLGRTYTSYDSLLLAFAILILLMLATIGLVPPIMKKSQIMPGANYPRP